MSTAAAKTTWVVVLQGTSASVFERTNCDGALTHLQDVAVEAPEKPLLRGLASWLAAARRARSFERLMLVAPDDNAGDLVSGLSRPTRALAAATQPEVLRSPTCSGPAASCGRWPSLLDVVRW